MQIHPRWKKLLRYKWRKTEQEKSNISMKLPLVTRNTVPSLELGLVGEFVIFKFIIMMKTKLKK